MTQHSERSAKAASTVPSNTIESETRARRAALAPSRSGPRAAPATSRAWIRSYRRNAVLLDATAGAVGAAVGYVVRFGGATVTLYVLAILVAPILWITAVSFAHGYAARFMGGVSAEEYRALVQAALVSVAVVSVTAYSSRLAIARGFILVAVLSALAVSLLLRWALRASLSRQRAKGKCLQRTVVVGRVDSAAALIRQFQRARGHGMHVVAACVSGLEIAGERVSDINGVPVFGPPDRALSAVDLFDADVVAVSGTPDLGGEELRRLSWSLEERKVDLVVAPGILEVAGPRLSIRPADGMPLLHVERPVTIGARRVLKTVVDQVLALAITIVAMPVLILVALVVRLDSPGPILFRQTRVGAQGEEFRMLKFRTMVADAEERRAHIPKGHEVNALLFKAKQDPRITRVGKVLRRYSIDELPQLFNVLAGTMSLVGPRPPLPEEVAMYEPDALRRLRVRPGLTGLWQVSGRSNLNWEDSLRLDLWYVDNWSLVLDAQILVRTVRAVCCGSGAY
jgi:exopolysaccharide biosynthesis polyprenyl glycosylphosphotransferase